MKLRNFVLALGLVFGLMVVAPQSRAEKGVKKTQGTQGTTTHVHHGVVIHVEHKKDGHGSITIKHHHSKKKGATAQGNKVEKEHKFSVNKNTRFTLAHGKNHKSTTFSAVHKGEHVAITSKGHHAEHVVIHEREAARKPKT
jgi:hypothetical protein